VEQNGATHYDSVRPDGLDAAIRQLNAGAVMALGYAAPFDRGAIRAAARFDYPLLLRAETTDAATQRSWWKRCVRDIWLRRLYSRCSRLLFVGQRSREHFSRLGVADERLVFSPYCVDTAPFHCSDADRAEMRESARKELGVGTDKIVMLFSGKLVPRKGVDLLPETVRLLPTDIRDRIILAYLGDGELRGQLSADAARHPTIASRFIGFQNQTALSRYYHAADLLVLPSREGETWGLVVNEALHHGVPVVTTDSVGSAPDLVQPGVTGEVCGARSAAALAGAIVNVVPLLRRADVRQRCREVVSRYSVAAAAQGVATAFQSVAL
jgi:glycosyltransferase involved in cell wall biosynthesis